MTEVHIRRDFSVPAAIQFKNPGAMWPNAIATKWGSNKWQYLSDGTGQGGGGHGNKIAIFDNWVDGICAQMDLWRTSKNYRNQTFLAAISVWSGHNHVQSYVDYLKSRVPGLTEGMVMNDAFWRGPMAIPFLRAQAHHEAGKPIPATLADYQLAQKRVTGGIPAPSTVKKAAGAIVVSALPTAISASQGHSSLVPALLIGIVVLVGAVAVLFYQKYASTSLSAPAPTQEPPHEQVQERLGSPPDPQPVLRDQSGQDASPVHTEGA